jgi:hypothetical protein
VFACTAFVGTVFATTKCRSVELAKVIFLYSSLVQSFVQLLTNSNKHQVVDRETIHGKSSQEHCQSTLEASEAVEGIKQVHSFRRSRIFMGVIYWV